MAEAARLSVVLDARITQFEKKVATAEKRMQTAAQKMGKDGKKIDGTFAKIGGSSAQASVMVERFSRTAGLSLGGLSVAAGGAAAAIGLIGVAARGALRAGEDMKRLRSQLTALTGSAERAEGLIRAMFATADETGIGLKPLGEIQTRMLLAGESIAATDSQVSELTNNIIKLGRIGGSSTTDITNGSVQLAQALASGVLQGDELKSIMENMPLLAKAIADGLGVGVGELKKMGENGELITTRVFGALLSRTGEITEQFKVLAVVSETAMGRLAAAMTRVGSAIDSNVGLSSTWTGILNGAASAAGSIADELERALEATNEHRNFEAANAFEGKLRGVNREIEEKKAMLAGGGTNLNPLFAFAAAREAERDSMRADIAALEARRAELVHALAAMPRSASGGPRRGGAGAGRARPPAYQPIALTPFGAPVPLGAPGVTGDFATNSPPAKPGAAPAASPTGQTDMVAALTARLNDMASALEGQQGAIGKAGVELARYNAELRAAEAMSDALQEAVARGVPLTEDEAAAVDAAGAAYIRQSEAMAAAEAAHQTMQDAVEDAKQSQREMNELLNGAADALAGVALGTNSWEAALFSLAKQILSMPAVQGGLSDFLGSILGSVASGIGGGVTGGSIGGVRHTVTPTGPISGFYATGGIAEAGRKYMVGERGPEPFVPSVRGRVLSVPQAQAALSGGGGGGMTVHVDARGATDPAQIEAAVRRAAPAIAAATARSTVYDMRRRGQA